VTVDAGILSRLCFEAPADTAGSVSVVWSAASPAVSDLARETVAARALMEARTGFRADGLSLNVRVCGSDAEYAAAGGPGNTDACFIPPDRILLRRPVRLRESLAHEVTHALIRHASGGRCPGWLEEGIVNHETRVTPDGQYTPRTLERIERAFAVAAWGRTDWSLRGLRAGARQCGDISDAFYGAAWSATDYLYRVYGRDAVLRAVARMSRRGCERAFRETFGRSSGEVEAEWRRATENEWGARFRNRTPR
jgi:hypothetical protein